METAPHAGRHRILLVEDDRLERMNLSLVLGRAGFDFDVAANAKEAHALLAHERYELVLTDIGLPDGDGIEILHAAKRASAATKVVLVTGSQSQLTPETARLEGAESLMLKPFALATFLETVRGLLVVLALIFLAAPFARAAAPSSGPSNDDCLSCHDDATLKANDGRSINVPAKPFSESIHGSLSCTDCHADLATAELPHAAKLARVDCGACHADPVAAYEKGVHAKARSSGNTAAARCVDCHGMHDIRPSTDPRSPTYPLNLPNTCGSCHGDAKIIREGGIKIGDVFAKYHDSIHGKALEKSGLLVSAKCTDCHGNHDIRRRSDPDSGVARKNVPATCGKCHRGILALYASGIHGSKLAEGDTKAPVCIDCHTAHEIRRTDADAWKLDVLAECGSCHTQSLKTYRDTFHGQVTNLGFARVASCSDCHRAHDVFPASNARSSVSRDNRVATCRKCHASAGPGFAGYDPHADKHDGERNPPLYWAARFMQLLLTGVFVFFGLHTSLWFQRLLRKDKPPTTKKVRA